MAQSSNEVWTAGFMQGAQQNMAHLVNAFAHEVRSQAATVSAAETTMMAAQAAAPQVPAHDDAASVSSTEAPCAEEEAAKPARRIRGKTALKKVEACMHETWYE